MPRPPTLPFTLDLPNRSAPPRGDGRPETATPGLNFAAIDPLNLLAAPKLSGAAGSGDPVALLQDRLARFLLQPDVMTFASGSDATRAALGAMLDASGAVIVDAGCDPAMFETVWHSQAQLHRCPPGSVDAVERRLVRLARQPRRGRTVVVVPAVSRLSSVAADLAELSALCAAHHAILVVDATQDLGAIGPFGQGMIEVQGCLGRIDVILGNLAGTFAAPGGFAVCRDPSLTLRIRANRCRVPPLSPSGAARLLGALDVVESCEGARRRRILHGNVLRLRNHLMADGLRVLGHPSPVVPVQLAPHRAAALGAMVQNAGPVVPLLLAPEVAGHAPRWHIRLTSDHGPADIDNLADLLRDVTRAVDRPAHTPRELEPSLQP